MSTKQFSIPAFGDSLPVSASTETLNFLSRRRSVSAARLSSPGPNPEQITTLLTLATRAPDHGKLCPWRFIIIQGESRNRLGHYLKTLKEREEPEINADLLLVEQNRFLRAPVIIAAISKACSGKKIPEWEQILSMGAVCQNLLLAANALGFGIEWLTEWYAYHSDFRAFLGVEAEERIAGFFHIGTAQSAPLERPRPSVHTLIHYF